MIPFYTLIVLAGLAAAPGPTAGQSTDQPLTFAQCLEIAYERNASRTAAQHGVQVARALRDQARSTFWPQLDLKSTLTRLDDDPVFTFPEETSAYTIEDFLANPLQVQVTIPDKQVKVLDRTDFRSMVDLTFPLYTGGKRRGLVQQASAGVDAAGHEARKTDLQLRHDVQRYYYGALLASRLVETGEEAIERLEVTLDLTESLYKRGSGAVTKADYLQHKVVVESARSTLTAVKAREDHAQTALVNALGLPYDARIRLAEEEIPFESRELELQSLVERAYRSNPDWSRIEAGLKAAEGKVREARSEGRPNVALLGRYEHIVNDYDAGAVGPSMKRNWRVGVGVQFPLFTGFRTRAEAREAEARMDRLNAQKSLLKDGLAARVRVLRQTIVRAQEQERAAAAALETATDNRDLNVRAYQDQLVEVEDVIQAQIMESFAIAQYEKVRYDQLLAVAQLELVTGANLRADE